VLHAVLNVDGIMGSKTLDTLNLLARSLGYSTIINEIRFQAACVYRDIVFANPGQEKFLNGWMNRARA